MTEEDKSATVVTDVQNEEENEPIPQPVASPELQYINALMHRRIYSAYATGRKNPADFFERPKSKREWWRIHVTDHPVPGTYKTRDFLDVSKMNPVQATYNFKGQGREKKAGIAHQGDLLLPGAYQHKDFTQCLENRQISTAFKSSGRTRTPTGFKDKDLNLPPWRYNLICEPVGKHKRTYSAFKSQTIRFPTDQFKAKEGPPPCAYNPKQPIYKYPISSSFTSRTIRFRTSQTKVPGPGAYDPTVHKYPQIPTLQKMGKMHGLYFANTFQA